MKTKFAIKKIKQTIKIYFSLPHIWVLVSVSVLSIVMCFISIVFKNADSFLSSLFANIFSGLITGVIICLISTIKSVSLYRTKCLITWLNELHCECLKFINMHNKILFYKKDDFNDDEELYDYIYDTLCCGNGISQKICYAHFEKTLPFNTYKYCKNVFSFDAEEAMGNNEILREDIIRLDISALSKVDIRKLFKPMDHQILDLNHNILSKLRELDAKKNAINISIG